MTIRESYMKDINRKLDHINTGDLVQVANAINEIYRRRVRYERLKSKKEIIREKS